MSLIFDRNLFDAVGLQTKTSRRGLAILAGLSCPTNIESVCNFFSNLYVPLVQKLFAEHRSCSRFYVSRLTFIFNILRSGAVRSSYR